MGPVVHSRTPTPRCPTVSPLAGTRPEKIRLQKWYTVFKVCAATHAWRVHDASPLQPRVRAPSLPQDHITLEDYEIHDGMGLELFYN